MGHLLSQSPPLIFLKVGGRMIRITVDKKGFEKTGSWLNHLAEKAYLKRLDKYGKQGVDALSAATPRDTGKTASSWGYEIWEDEKAHTYNITWYNTNVNNHVNVALVLQFGHATRPGSYIDPVTGKKRYHKSGGWVEGIDYINPALKPIFDSIVEDAWMEISARVK